MLLLNGSHLCDDQALLAQTMNRSPSAPPALSSPANGRTRSPDGSDAVPSVDSADAKRGEAKRPSPESCAGGSENRDPNCHNSTPLCSLKRKLNNPAKTGVEKVCGQHGPHSSAQRSSPCENDCSFKQAGQASNFDINSPPRKHACNSRRCASNNPHYALPVQVLPRKYLVSKRHLPQAGETSVCKCCIRQDSGSGGECDQKKVCHNCRITTSESSPPDCSLIPQRPENPSFLTTEGNGGSNEEFESGKWSAEAMEEPLTVSGDLLRSQEMSSERDPKKSPLAPYPSDVSSVETVVSGAAVLPLPQESPQHCGTAEHNTQASPSWESDIDCLIPGDQLDVDIPRQPQPNPSADVSSECGILEDVHEYEGLELPKLIIPETIDISEMNWTRNERHSEYESAAMTDIPSGRDSFHYRIPPDETTHVRNDREAAIPINVCNELDGFEKGSLIERRLSDSQCCTVVNDTGYLERDSERHIEPACTDQHRHSPCATGEEISVGAELGLNTRCSSSSPLETVSPESPEGTSSPESPEKTGNWRLNAVLQSFQNISPKREGRVKTLVRAFESLLSFSEIGVEAHKPRSFPLQFSYHSKKSDEADGSSRDRNGQSEDSGEERPEELMPACNEPSGPAEGTSAEENNYEGVATLEAPGSSNEDDTGPRIGTELDGSTQDEVRVDKANSEISSYELQFRSRKKRTGKQQKRGANTKSNIQDRNPSSQSKKKHLPSTATGAKGRESPSKSKVRRSAKSGSQSGQPKGSFCKPQPFKLRTQERGQMKEQEFLMRLKKMLDEEERLRIPLAQGLPWTTDEPEVLLKPPIKDSTVPIDVHLYTEFRAMERAEFDAFIGEKLLYLEQRRLEQERLRQIEEEEEIKKMRKEMVPKAQLMPYFDRPFRPRRSSKRPTIPKEPFCQHSHAKRAKCAANSA